MAISLYPHNKEAYEALLAMLAVTGKACVVHPTGTGKSFIGFQYCAEQPDERVCWISPSEYIFRTQCENLTATGAAVPGNITFLTYAKLNLMSAEEMAELRPDVILLDEFHRGGAPAWQLSLTRLLSLYPDAKLIGLSATNVRYLDGRRDMADELFDGGIASEMTLGEAIVRGILNTPTYVTSVFAYQKDYDRLKRRVYLAKSKAVRNEAERYLEALRRALERADGLDVIFEKHMADRTGKYLVFCANAEHMREMMLHVPEWFDRIDTAPHIYSVYADDPASERSFRDFKADDSAHLRLLFCIDMLNEGVHVEDVSGVILFRPTVSPIIYKQQIGRALSASKTGEAVIFDIVNNIENLYSIDAVEEEMRLAMTCYRSFGLDSQIVNERFRVIDEVRDCMELFERLNNTLGASWELMYAEAEKYRAENGDLNVPHRYVSADGYALGAWLDTQRRVRAGKERGALNDERVRLLDELGMRWESVSDASWNRNFAAAQAFHALHGNLNVSCNYVTEDGIRLGQWLARLRSCRKSDTNKACLTEERVLALERLGMQWDVFDYLFERNFAAAAEYHRAHGTLDVPGGYVGKDGVRLGSWIAWLRKMRKKGELRLTESQIARLDELGMIWGGRQQLAWERAFAAAKRCWEQTGRLDIPESYRTEDGFMLGKWISRQRDCEKKGELSEERRDRLEKLGMVWGDKQQLRWNRAYSAAKAYYEKNGHLDIPGAYLTDDGFGLGLWLKKQREYQSAGSLPEDRRRRLEEIGMIWEKKDPWDEKYALLEQYYSEYGSLKMSNRCKYHGVCLSQWLVTQRGRLRGKGKPLTPEQARKLRALGIGTSEKQTASRHINNAAQDERARL